MKNIGAGIYYGELSNGSFDITVQPILDLYKYSFENFGRPPKEEDIKDTLDLVDYRYVLIKDDLIILRKEGMKVTLGGIAKGYAIDRAVDVLKRYEIKHALVNAGGDMRAIGSKGDEDWRIALQNPRNKDEYITIIPLDNKAVATSGDYERYYDENKSFHHIVDPRTGYSAAELISVTIVADKAMDADAIATSVYVLGKEKGMELIERLDGVEGLAITKDKEIVRSSGFTDSKP
jgi:thiamine biosynthesis lipoprotein